MDKYLGHVPDGVWATDVGGAGVLITGTSLLRRARAAAGKAAAAMEARAEREAAEARAQQQRETEELAAPYSDSKRCLMRPSSRHTACSCIPRSMHTKTKPLGPHAKRYVSLQSLA